MSALDWAAASGVDAVRRALEEHADELRSAGSGHAHDAAESVRRASHRGHAIEIRTSYRITVDGRPFEISAAVDNGGRVHYHGLPTRDFASTVDLVKDAIDTFPEDFADGAPTGHGQHEHGRQDSSPGPHEH